MLAQFVDHHLLHQGQIIYENHYQFSPHHEKFVPSTKEVPPQPLCIENWKVFWRGVSLKPPPRMTSYSILFCLPYWTRLKINHLLYLMHIFKNAKSNIWDHLIRKKDTLRRQEDLKLIGHLETTCLPRKNENVKMELPEAPWILSKNEERGWKIKFPPFVHLRVSYIHSCIHWREPSPKQRRRGLHNCMV